MDNKEFGELRSAVHSGDILRILECVEKTDRPLHAIEYIKGVMGYVPAIFGHHETKNQYDDRMFTNPIDAYFEATGPQYAQIKTKQGMVTLLASYSTFDMLIGPINRRKAIVLSEVKDQLVAPIDEEGLGLKPSYVSLIEEIVSTTEYDAFKAIMKGDGVKNMRMNAPKSRVGSIFYHRERKVEYALSVLLSEDMWWTIFQYNLYLNGKQANSSQAIAMEALKQSVAKELLKDVDIYSLGL